MLPAFLPQRGIHICYLYSSYLEIKLKKEAQGKAYQNSWSNLKNPAAIVTFLLHLPWEYFITSVGIVQAFKGYMLLLRPLIFQEVPQYHCRFAGESSSIWLPCLANSLQRLCTWRSRWAAEQLDGLVLTLACWGPVDGRGHWRVEAGVPCRALPTPWCLRFFSLLSRNS